jgi:hypothetical protein
LAGLFALPTSLFAQGVCPPGNVRVAPNSRYLQLTPGPVGEVVVVDVQTGLIWKQCQQGASGAACALGSATALTWAAALAAADAETHAGISGWRLPNRNELRSLVERGCWSPAINTGNVDSWTSTSNVGNPTLAWSVGFGDGGVAFGAKSGTQNVRLVRGGDQLEGFDAGADFTPAGFSLAAQNDVPASTLLLSGTVVVSAIDTPVGIGVGGDASSEYRINGSAYTALPGVVRNGDQVEVRHLSAAGANAATTTTLRVGNQTADFVSTTIGAAIYADGFEG